MSCRANPVAVMILLSMSLVAAIVPMAAAEGEQSRAVLLDPHADFEYLPQTPSVAGGSVAAMANPAAWLIGDGGEFSFWWDDQNGQRGTLDNWGFSFGRRLGISRESRLLPCADGYRRVNDTQIGLAFGKPNSAFGLAWRWSGSSGSIDLPRHEDALVVGHIIRPVRWLSYGVAYQFSMDSAARIESYDLGLRPFGTDLLTLCADLSTADGEKFEDGAWSAGFEVRPIDGLRLGARVVDRCDDDLRFVFNAGITFGGYGLQSLPAVSEAGAGRRTTWLLRTRTSSRGLGGRFPCVLQECSRAAVIDLENRVLDYQRYRWGNDRRVAWLDLYRMLAEVRDDPHVRGLLLNLSGFGGRPSLVWEMRSVLEEIDRAGKEITIQIDRGGMMLYYLASVADHVNIDPQGGLTLPGLAMKRTYVKGMLDKLGLGFQEFRYFKYKSAADAASRTDMSEADREQRGRIVDVIYETIRAGVADGRDLDEVDFDAIVDGEVMLSPARAEALGLVDGIGRWTDLPEQSSAWLMPVAKPGPWRPQRDEVWGPPKRIAVVYALGECSMDEGIRGRATSAYLRSLVGDPTVAAVVLRADSPGGDPLPSDLVAEAVTQLREAGKPVIVSQGDVAASGGYWISMNGSHIMTTPLTITASIGVIAGWIYDDGFGERTGLSADGVQRGAHADLFTSMRLPLLGVSLPTRALDEAELGLIEKYIRAMYDEFVAAVAAGRDLSEEEIRRIAEGRVWMGGDALERELVDSIGTLPDAIEMAADLAGLPNLDDVAVVEYPPRKLFGMPKLFPSLPGVLAGWWPFGGFTEPVTAESESVDYQTRYLRTLAADGATPQLLLPPDLLPDGWLD